MLKNKSYVLALSLILFGFHSVYAREHPGRGNSGSESNRAQYGSLFEYYRASYEGRNTKAATVEDLDLT